MKETADKVYRNAKVYSVALDGTETHAEALVIKDGKFAYVGDETGATEWIGNTTEVIDCKGKSVIPGLGDAHLHHAQAVLKYGHLLHIIVVVIYLIIQLSQAPLAGS